MHDDWTDWILYLKRGFVGQAALTTECAWDVMEKLKDSIHESTQRTITTDHVFHCNVMLHYIWASHVSSGGKIFCLCCFQIYFLFLVFLIVAGSAVNSDEYLLSSASLPSQIHAYSILYSTSTRCGVPLNNTFVTCETIHASINIPKSFSCYRKTSWSVKHGPAETLGSRVRSVFARLFGCDWMVADWGSGWPHGERIVFYPSSIWQSLEVFWVLHFQTVTL